MKIFNNSAFVDASATVNYAQKLEITEPEHMLPPDSPYFGNGTKALHLQKTVGAQGITRAGTFEQAMLQALDKVSDVDKFTSELQQQAIIDPDSVNIHNITMAQAQSEMALGITRNILSRLVQGWRDLINTR